MKERVLGFRNIVVYASTIFAVPILIRNGEYVRNLLNVWFIFGFILSVFSIFQGIFFQYLPEILQTYNGEIPATFHGTELIRVNGLLGNQIIFTGFIVMYLLLSYSFWKDTKKPKYLLYTLTALIASFLTYSRVVYIAVFIMLLMRSMLKISFGTGLKLLLYSMLLLGGIFLINWGLDNKLWSIFQSSFMFQRLSGEDITTQGSDEGHLFITLEAINAIVQNPLLGLGMGSQGESSGAGLGTNSIIPDGSWFQLLLELGVPVSIIFFVIQIVIFRVLIKNGKKSEKTFDKSLSIGIASYLIFVFFVGFVDSIFTYRITYILYWFFISLLLVKEREVKTNNT